MMKSKIKKMRELSGQQKNKLLLHLQKNRKPWREHKPQKKQESKLKDKPKRKRKGLKLLGLRLSKKLLKPKLQE